MFLYLAMLAFTNTAIAATYNLGEAPYTPDSNGSFNDTFTVTTAGTFTDIYNFYLDGSIGSDFSAAATDTGVGIDFSNIELFSGFDALGSVVTSGTVFNGASFSFANADDNLVAGNPYSVKLIGSAAANNSTYNFSATPVSAVPAPAAVALMLSGLAMVGFMVYRRKDSNL